MQFAAAVSRHEETAGAARELTDALRRQISDPLDLMFVFLTYHHRDTADLLSATLRRELKPRVLLGCTAEGVIGPDREIEREPAVSVLAGRLPGVSLEPFHIGMEEWEEMLTADRAARLRERIGADVSDIRAFLLLGDPFTTPITELLEALDALVPGIPTIGGMASGAGHAGQNVLLLDGAALEEGVVGVRIAGPVRVDTVVSQGCKPIGETLLVTRAEGNLIHALGGRPALEVVQELLLNLGADEQELVQNGLFLGIVMDEYKPAFSRGDFLIRSVLGANRNSGAVAVGEAVRAGQTVQFHVRDADTADEDLRLMMQQAAQDEAAPYGGLLFSCNGRGTRLFPRPNHDVRGVLEVVPETPLAGFFANGELGPVGDRNFIHGHTASIALFRPTLD